MSDERIYRQVCYAPPLKHWLTCEQAAQRYAVLAPCARQLLQDLAAACVIRRQWVYQHCYYHRDDVELVVATLMRRPLVDAALRQALRSPRNRRSSS
jgi:hypothetical protein